MLENIYLYDIILCALICSNSRLTGIMHPITIHNKLVLMVPDRQVNQGNKILLGFYHWNLFPLGKCAANKYFFTSSGILNIVKVRYSFSYWDSWPLVTIGFLEDFNRVYDKTVMFVYMSLRHTTDIQAKLLTCPENYFLYIFSSNECLNNTLPIYFHDYTGAKL